MKILAILSALILVVSVSLQAQDIQNGDQKNKSSQSENQSQKETDATTLDKLQKETEDISVMKPIFFIAAIIESRLELHRLERESVAAAKSRESGSK
ncbi:MAG TPA: hypothetical protein PLD84_10965 [Chitinophagales bacterium]|nr:hypothetical protein [Chitinophagales bacterium]